MGPEGHPPPPIFPDAVVQSAWFSVVLLHLDAARNIVLSEGALCKIQLQHCSERLQAQLTGRAERTSGPARKDPFNRKKLNPDSSDRPTDGRTP